jgi:hypothetical protein
MSEFCGYAATPLRRRARIEQRVGLAILMQRMERALSGGTEFVNRLRERRQTADPSSRTGPKSPVREMAWSVSPWFAT